MSDAIEPSSVIRRTVNIYRGQARVLLPLSAVVFGVTGIISAILIAAASPLIYASFLISDVAIVLFAGMAVGLVDDVQNGRRDTSVGQMLSIVMPVLGQLILVGIVTGIGIFVGFILIVVPGLILATVWSVVAPVVVLERPGGLRALSRSRELVRGNGWQVFSVIFVLLFLVGLLASGIDFAANSAGTGVGVVVRVIVGIFTAPLGALTGAVLYFDLCDLPGAEGYAKTAPSATILSDVR